MEEYQEVVESTNPRTGILFLAAIVGFFIFLAIAVPYIKARGGSTDSLFFAVLAAVAGAILLPIILNIILSKLHLKGKTRREIAEAFIGYTPTFEGPENLFSDADSIVDAFLQGTSERSLVPYAGGVPALYDDYDEADPDTEELTAIEDTAIIEEN